MGKNKLSIAIDVLQKNRGKIFSQDQLFLLFDQASPELQKQSNKYKLIYYLKLRGYLVLLRRGLFLVKNSDQEFSEDMLILLHYWKVLYESLKADFGFRWYLGGLKALEIHLQDFDIVDEVLIVNPNKQTNEIILFNKMMQLKTYAQKKENLIGLFCKYTDKIMIGRERFLVACGELAVLETLYNSSTLQQSYAETLIKKWLRKHKKSFNYEVIIAILRAGKHNSSINRLVKIAKEVDIGISEHLLDIIKKYGHVLY